MIMGIPNMKDIKSNNRRILSKKIGAMKNYFSCF